MKTTDKDYRRVSGAGKRVGIVVTRFHAAVTDALLVSAQAVLKSSGVNDEHITVISVPGSMELPYALLRLAQQKKFDCLIALGCIIRGETAHFDYVCKTAQEGVLRVSLDCGIPIGFGVITANNVEQAQARAYFGEEAALAALELAEL